MPVWKDQVLGFVPEADWLSIPFSPVRQNDPIDSLFSDQRTDNLAAAWYSISAEYQVPMMAQFHGFDTESQTTFRAPVDAHNIEKGLIKVKLNQSERLRELLGSGVQENALYDYVLKDGMRLAEQVITRSKVAKNELMATGKVTIRENNLNLTVDYGVPEEQTNLELDLSPEADIPGQLQDLVEKASDAGVALTGLLTSRQNLTKMRRNAALQKAVNGNVGAGALIRRAALEAYMEDELGIGRIITNDLVFGASAEIGEDGRPVISKKRYYPAGKLSFFAANSMGLMGDGLWGNPPEATVGALSTGANSSEHPYVYIDQWTEHDPKVLWTKASGLFMPVLWALLSANPIGAVVTVIGLLVAGFIYLWNTSEGFREFWIGLWENLVGAVSAAWEGITGFFSGIGNAVSDFWGWLTGSEKEALDTMESDVNGTWDSIEGSTTETFGNMELALSGSFDSMTAAAGTATGEISGSVDTAWTSAALSTDQNWGGMESQVVGALGSMSSVTQTATAAMGGAIDQTWTNASASTELNWLGMEGQVTGSLEGMTLAADGAGTDIFSSIDTSWTDANTSTDLNWEQMVATTGLKSDAAVTAVDTNFSRMENTVMDNLNAAKGSAMGQDWTSVGINIVDGMSYGVRQRAQELAGSVANAAIGALNAARSALDINSPSKKSEWLFEMVMRGGVVGVEKNAHLLTGAMEDVSAGLLDALRPGREALDFSARPLQVKAWNNAPAPEQSRGGDTYNFYSPKALDPVSAARELKKARQQMALNYV